MLKMKRVNLIHVADNKGKMLMQNHIYFLKNCRLNIIFAFIFFALFNSSCFWGPPLPEREAKDVLHRENVNETVIQKLIQREHLQNSEYAIFSQHKNDNVRFLIATNPHTPKDILSQLENDSSNLVLQGITRNPQISDQTLQKLLKHQSLLQYLVGNPRLSETEILEIYRKHKDIPLYYFAINPRCPSEIKKVILKSNDHLAKQWLEINSQKNSKKTVPVF